MSMSRRPGLLQDKDGPGLTFILVALVVVAVLGAKYFGFTPWKKAPAGTPQQSTQQPSVSETAPLVLLYTAHPSENYAPNPAHAKGTGDIAQVAQALQSALQQQKLRAQLVENIPVTPWSQAFTTAYSVLQPVVAGAQGLAAIVDVHRDAIDGKPDGYTTVLVNQKPVAKILLVVGDVDNPNLEANLAFAEEVRAELEALVPGICRGVKIMHDQVNGNLHPKAVQVHIGEYADNNTDEAQAAANYLAQAVARVLQRQPS